MQHGVGVVVRHIFQLRPAGVAGEGAGLQIGQFGRGEIDAGVVVGNAEQAHMHRVGGAFPQIVGDGELEIPFAGRVGREVDDGLGADDAALSRAKRGRGNAPLVAETAIISPRPVVAARAIQGDGPAIPLKILLIRTGVGKGDIGIVDHGELGPQRRIGPVLAGPEVAPIGVLLLPAGRVP